MATIDDLRARREALTAQRASGVARVSNDGKTVEYRSLAEIDRAIEALEREVAAAPGAADRPPSSRDHEQGPLTLGHP